MTKELLTLNYVSNDPFIISYFAQEPDFTIKIRGSEIKTHKLLLVSHSPILKVAIDECKQDDDDFSLDCDPETFQLTLDLLKYKNPDLTLDKLIDVANLVDYYNFDYLTKIVSVKMIEFEDIYRVYKEIKNRVKHKGVKQNIVDHICSCFSRWIGVSRDLLNSIDDVDDMLLFVENVCKKGDVVECYKRIALWGTLHSNSLDLSKYRKELPKLIDITTFTRKQLFELSDYLIVDFDKEKVYDLLLNVCTEEETIEKESEGKYRWQRIFIGKESKMLDELKESKSKLYEIFNDHVYTYL